MLVLPINVFILAQLPKVSTMDSKSPQTSLQRHLSKISLKKVLFEFSDYNEGDDKVTFMIFCKEKKERKGEEGTRIAIRIRSD